MIENEKTCFFCGEKIEPVICPFKGIECGVTPMSAVRHHEDYENDVWHWAHMKCHIEHHANSNKRGGRPSFRDPIEGGFDSERLVRVGEVLKNNPMYDLRELAKDENVAPRTIYQMVRVLKIQGRLEKKRYGATRVRNER